MARRLILLLTVLAALTGAASAEAKQLTKYQVGGGLAGRYSELTVQTDGRALQTGDSGEHHGHEFHGHLSSLADRTPLVC